MNHVNLEIIRLILSKLTVGIKPALGALSRMSKRSTRR